MDTNELYHYGVKGMKWGRRRSKRYIEKHNNRADRNINTIKNIAKQEQASYRKPNDPKQQKWFEEYVSIGKKDFENKIKNEEIYKRKISEIDVNSTKYKEVKNLVRKAEREHIIANRKSTSEYVDRYNDFNRRYASAFPQQNK